MSKRERRIKEVSYNWPDRAFVHKEPFYDKQFLGEYKLLQHRIGLAPSRIANPACGYDISLSLAFPEGEIYYIDPSLRIVRTLRTASLPDNTHVIQASLFDFQPPGVDLLVLRSANVGHEPSEVVDAVSPWVVESGIVVVSNQQGNEDASAFARRADMHLLGFIPPYDPSRRGPLFMTTDLPAVQQWLAVEPPSLAFITPTYVFRKSKKI